MNKKLIKILSFALSVIMLFGMVLTVSAEGETPAPVEKVSVRLRIEGLSKCLEEKKLSFDKNVTLKHVIENANINGVISADGKSIDSIMLEGSVAGSAWNYAVDGVIGTQTVDTYIVSKDISLVLYNATPDAVMPEIKSDEVESTGNIEFIGTDKSGNKAPIAGATITLDGEKTYTTDDNGIIYLSKEEMVEGKHSVQIKRVNENNVPTVVRFEKSTEVEIGKMADKGDSGKNIFEKAYDFLYSILKGVIDVWVFYIRAIVDIFEGDFEL